MRRLFVLRPEPGASETVQRAKAEGLEVIAAPLFRIEPLAWDAPDPGGFDALLLTSANAVRNGGAELHRLRALPVHAVGDATAEAARAAGFDIASSGDSGVDRLLGSIEGDLRLLHLAGEAHRRPEKARQSITAIEVYRAVPAEPDLDGIGGTVVAVHSPRAATRLAELVRSEDRRSVRIAAISAAAAQAAGSGWECVDAANEPSDTALLALAMRLCDKPEQQ